MSTKRRTFADILDNYVLASDRAENRVYLAEAKKNADLAIYHRPFAPSTQAQQDKHLSMYLQYIRFLLEKPKDTSDEDMEAEAFPEDSETLKSYLRNFISFTFQTAIPRSHVVGQRISYKTLARYRDSMLFWVERIFRLRQRSAGGAGVVPDLPNMFKDMTQTMRFLQENFAKGNSPNTSMTKSSVGLPELRQLIDYEMYHNICIENSEQHQVAWCIGRMVAVRPGSIGPSHLGRNEPLKWKDVGFTTGDIPGQFDVSLEFPNIAIKARQDIEKSAGSARPLRVTITSPTDPDSLVFSIPHRLLVIAIRRGILDGISSIDDLMNTNKHYILVKKEHLQEFIFFRSISKGTALNQSQPLTAPQLTDYLSTRGLALGYSQPVTWYSLRRKAATDLTQRVGADQARIILGHTLESRTLERFYLDLAPAMDLSRIQTEQPINAGGISTDLLKSNQWTLAVARLDREAVARTRGVALAAYTNMLIRLDANFPTDASDEELKQYRKVMTRRAKKEITAKEMELLKCNMTREEFQGRRGALNASAFAKSILERAQAILAGPPPIEEGNEEEFDDDPNIFKEQDDGYEEDIEESARRGDIEGALFLHPEEEPTDDQDDEVSLGSFFAFG